MSASQSLTEAIHAIRPYLPQLLDAPTSQQVNRKLDQLSNTPEAAEAVAQVLNQYDTTREWLRLYTEENLAADQILAHMRKYHPLIGSPNTIESPHYVCPVASCHQDWYRGSASQPIPRCPIHDLQLVRASKLEAGA